MAPSPANNYNAAPINYLSGFNNPYGYSPLASSRPTQQQTGNSFGGILSNGSSVKSAGQFIQNGFQLPQSGFVNSLGSSLGFASAPSGAPAIGGAIGPTLPGANVGALGTSATLSSVGGAAGIGAFAGSFLGKIGGNATGGSIGGGIGAGIGMAVGGPVGAVVGGLVGGIGGGFFGGSKPPTNASEFYANFTKEGTIGGFSYGAKNAAGYDSYNTSMAQELANYMGQLKPHLGITDFKEAYIRGGVNTKYSPSGQPGFLSVNDTVYGFDPNDLSSRQKAMGQAVAQLARDSGATDEQIKAATTQIEAANSPQGQAKQGMPFVPITNNAKFSEFMAKYNQPPVSTQ